MDDQNKLMVLLKKTRHGVFLLAVLLLTSCGLPSEEKRDITISFASSGERSPRLSAGIQGAASSARESLPISEVYPYPSKVTLSLHAYTEDNSVSYTSQEINRDFNNSQFEEDEEGNLLITHSTFALSIPDDTIVDMVLTIYNQAGYQYFQGALTIQPDDDAENGVAMPLEVAIDETIAKTVPCGTDSDSDGDGICDIYEDMFINLAGEPDVDGDGIVNSQDTDTDGDSASDADEGIEASNHGYPRFVHANFAPTAVSATIETLLETAVTGVAAEVTDSDVGDSHTISVETAPTNGTATITDNLIDYEPALGFVGSDNFEIRATDDGGLSVVGTVTVTVTAPSLAAYSQKLTTDEDTALTITLVGTDDTGATLTYTLTDPTSGTVTGTAPDLTYTPNANFNGSDSFTFTVSNGTDTSGTATIYIDVTAVNDTPVAEAQTVSTDEDSSGLSITLGATDVDSATLTYDFTTPGNGTLSGTAPDLFYVPSADFNGTDSFDFTVTDDGSLTSTATISIDVTAVNDAPVAVDDGARSNEYILTSSGSVLANGVSGKPAIDQLGRFVAFWTEATNLGGTQSTFADLYVRDTVNGIETLLTEGDLQGVAEAVDAGPATVAGASRVSIKADGSIIAFDTDATNMPTPSHTNNLNKRIVYFAYHNGDNTYNIQPLDMVGECGNVGPFYDPDMANINEVVVFTGELTSSYWLCGVDNPNNVTDVYLFDPSGNFVTLQIVLSAISDVSGNAVTFSDGNSYSAVISDDALYAAFVSEATNLISIDTDATADIYLKETTGSYSLSLISVDTSATPNTGGNAASSEPSINGDGSRIAFTSLATNLVANDDNDGFKDIYLSISGAITRISNSVDGSAVDGDSSAPQISADGRYIVFQSAATNLVAGDDNGVIDTFLYDTVTQTTQRLTDNGNGDSTQPVMSDSGRYVIYTTEATNLDAGVTDNNAVADIIRLSLTDKVIYSSNSINIDVLANDTDVDGDTLSILSIATTEAKLGTVVDNSGTVDYTAGPNQGLDTFTYTVSDGALEDTATVSVAVELAQITDDAFIVNNPVYGHPLPVLNNDVLPANHTYTITGFTWVDHQGLGSTTLAISLDGQSLEYESTSGVGFGVDTFTYEVSDESGTVVGTGTVTVNNAGGGA